MKNLKISETPNLEPAANKRNWILRFTGVIERIGNKLPHPFYLFIILIGIIMVTSAIMSALDVSVSFTAATSSGKMVEQTVSVVNLFSKLQLQNFFQNFVKAYQDSPNLTAVLIIVMCVAICDETGFFEVSLKRVLSGASTGFITFTLAIVSICANILSDGGAVLVITIGAIIYKAAGRNPWIGIAVAYAGASAGYVGNFLPSVGDVVVASITNSVSEPLGYSVNPMINYFFQAAATIILAFAIVVVEKKVLVPLYGDTDQAVALNNAPDELRLTQEQHRGMKFAGLGAGIFAVLMLIGTIPENGFFRSESGALIPSSPLMSSLVALISLFFVILGVTYGYGSGVIKHKNDIPKMMAKGISRISSLVLILFPVALMLYMFIQSNLAYVIAVYGQKFLTSINFTGIPMLVTFIVVLAIMNLFLSSASAKWMLLAPILIPMFLGLGIPPAIAQLVYRIGDSCTNNLTPLNAAIVFAIASMNQYRIPEINPEEAGMGTLLSGQFVFSLVFLVIMTVMFLVFMTFNIPVGLGA
jgi:aminobenzoyl-glutamate transport protein